MEGKCDRHRAKTNTFIVTKQKPKLINFLERYGRRYEDNIKMDFKEIL